MPAKIFQFPKRPTHPPLPAQELNGCCSQGVIGHRCYPPAMDAQLMNGAIFSRLWKAPVIKSDFANVAENWAMQPHDINYPIKNSQAATNLCLSCLFLSHFSSVSPERESILRYSPEEEFLRSKSWDCVSFLCKMTQLFSALCICLCLLSVCAAPENTGAKSRVHDGKLSNTEHYDKDGEHNAEYDHEAFLGKQKKSFDQLTPEESKERLG